MSTDDEFVIIINQLSVNLEIIQSKNKFSIFKQDDIVFPFKKQNLIKINPKNKNSVRNSTNHNK